MKFVDPKFNSLFQLLLILLQSTAYKLYEHEQLITKRITEKITKSTIFSAYILILGM